ncbi:UDP-2,4-diacetamido-2,4,6-trideoxy-beta-L-altropyranose hydrolase [Succinivibrio dextrinosolvens]|uniref:UDP-2,4-diacetamido-2,4, 6-trideoxy-beta-L-altropyranose hydrolase n=1 Tax=Succinivibrio dextrinosolvens TaxID=83771 RepID=UPI0008E9A923|nr:UDP-2,4-diacetamido-2,4,6-trideoxy-beta-L-altropyranose hydrolase [Succinivibrio dextrinosolvens]SFS46696.1 UDP-2,4-diacetamido-2,4,6-trideoxy-beta-L-altropyranose hydrolase [Succinivibrio dextrinosolvens]
MNKNLVVVLKADSQIGTGHLMRVKGLLPYLNEYNLYLCSDSLSDELRSQCNEYTDIIITAKDKLSETVLSLNPQLVIVDHYYLDEEFETPVYEKTKVVVIDDLENRRHKCHLLIDQSEGRTKYRELVPPECRLCLGYKYNFIKKEFFEVKRSENSYGKPRVLVNFGGADPVHGCKLIAKSIMEGELYKEFIFTMISGLSNPDFGDIKKIISSNSEITLIRNSAKINEVFSNTDLAIGACGGMFRERIAAGIPSINVEIADNQAGTCKGVVKKYNLGECATLSDLSNPELIKDKLNKLNKNYTVFEKNCRNFIKERGIENIVRAIRELIK